MSDDDSDDFERPASESGGDDDESSFASDSSSVKPKKKGATKTAPAPAPAKKTAPSKSTAKTAETKKKPAAASKETSTVKAKSAGTSSGVQAKETAPVSAAQSSTTTVTSTTSVSVSAAAEGYSGGEDITRGPNCTTEAGAKKLLLQYLHQQNRPYSSIQIFDNLHKRIPKPTVEKVMQSLAEQTEPPSLIRSKEYGKLRLFWSEQANLNPDNTPEQLEVLEERVGDLKQELADRLAEEKRLSAELSGLTGQPTDAELESLAAALTKENGEKARRLASLTSGAAPDPQAMVRAVAEHNFFRQSWVKRRAQCMEAADLLGEQMEKKRRDVLALLGVETDDDAGAALPDLAK